MKRIKIIENLKQLVKTPTPSGFEESGVEAFKKCLKRPYPEYSDNIGNFGIYLGKSGSSKKKILVSAHIDELGFQVIDINKEGLAKVITLGGIDKKTISGNVILFKTENGNYVKGIVAKKPIHAENQKERNDMPEIHELNIDFGVSSKERLEALGIGIGSVGFYNRDLNPTTIMLGDNICAPGLDDKAGVAILALLAELIDEEALEKNDYEVCLAICTQEEMGLRGAMVLANNLKPDISIDIDVTPTSDFGVNSAKWGNIKLGEGPVIDLGPGSRRKIGDEFIKLAKEEKIEIQPSVFKPGGTNTAAFQLFGGDCATQLISIPIRNLHTPTECCNPDDIVDTAKLIAGIINEGRL